MLDHKDAKGNPIKLEMVLYLPPGNGPFNVVLYAHGGPPPGQRAYAVDRPDEATAPFLKNNIAVVFMVRQGRGRSGGLISLPKCNIYQGIASVEDGVDDTKVGLNFIKQSHLFVGKKIYTTGLSQGGLIAAILAARYPETISKAIAFTPGWYGIGNNQVCRSFAQNFQNQMFETIAKSKASPTMFIYAENDGVFPPSSVAESFEDYTRNGGTGVLKKYPPTITRYGDGHSIIFRPDVWEKDVMEFLGITK